jgi:hypothetical protein
MRAEAITQAITLAAVTQQTSAQGSQAAQQAQADAAAALRQAVDQVRAAEAQARNAAMNANVQARQAQAEARQAQAEARQAQAEARMQADAARQGLPVPDAPVRVRVENGRVIVDDGGGMHVARAGQLPPGFPTDVPPNAANVAYMFFVTMAVIAIGIPLARAFGRWLDRRTVTPPALNADVTARLERIEQAVETVALEVERISEGQRFTSKLMAELRQLPQLEGARIEGTRAEGTRFPEPRR